MNTIPVHTAQTPATLTKTGRANPNRGATEHDHSRHHIALARDRIQAALAGVVLGDPVPDFPVQATHRVASDMAKLDGPVLQADSEFAFYAATRLHLLEQRPDALLMAADPPPAALWPAIWRALGLHEAAWTRALGLRLTDEEVGLGVFEALLPASMLTTVPHGALALTLALQEDWVLMNEGGVFECGAVCFPSGWAPGEKHGLPLSQIHQPVADGEALRKASPALARAMAVKGPFVRHVWTLCRNDSLARHPGYPGDTAAESGEALYFRSERQTTLALPGFGRALFLIRIKVAPLEQVLSAKEKGNGDESVRGDPRDQRLARLKSALDSMSDAVLAYKNLAEIREQVRKLD